MNKSTLREQILTRSDRLSGLVEANMADSMADLQKIQLHYQGALQSGAKILNLSLLDYVR